MKEFSRIDSEEEILGDYGDCTSRTQCIRDRSSLEKFLFLFSVVLFIIVIALSVVIGNQRTSTGTFVIRKRRVTSKACVEAANNILLSMDPSANPCDNFYQYACGGWEMDTPIPPGYPLWDRFQELSYKNLFHLKKILDSQSVKYSSGLKAQRFYTSCMKESREDRGSTMRKFYDLITNVSREGRFDLTLENVHLLNVWPIFSISVGPDERNTNKNIIKVDYGDYQYPFDGASKDNTSSNINQTTPRSTRPVYLTWKEHEVEKRYIKETIHILKVFWNKTDEDAASMADQLMVLEKKFATINWMLYLDVVLSQSKVKLSVDQEIVVLHEDGLLKICKIVHEYKDRNETELLDVYLSVYLARALMPYFDASTFDGDLDPTKEIETEGEHWRRCVFYTNRAFGFVTGAMYVNGTSKENTIKKIKNLVSEVKETFKDYLLQKHWLDSNTRKRAEEKVDEMLEKISYPDDILKSHFLDDLYNDFEVGDDWFTNINNMNKFKMKKMTEVLGNPVDRKSFSLPDRDRKRDIVEFKLVTPYFVSRWIRPPVTVESDYSPVRNDIMFPIAMFHLPFYTEGGPQALNFGAMGTIIGHEITHAFDITGRQYDGKGQLKEWWGKFSARDFEKTTRCMKDQYDKYSLDGFQINGDKTLDENIADNGGLRASYIAYQLWERKHGESLPLPGIKLTNKQLFFVSYAQMFCSKWKRNGLKSHIIDDKHSPGPIRVRGVISNSNAFADLFSCPFISEYNPQTKCEVW
ncbi:hypothetical protein FSP39_023569 [Pinctada imbricata]|uniref:Endothelin-converting enzyme 1 n=1 Tax=Pinctada imbricata TaxID=66713 RepID=A0AA88Y617_PINIB|nr:hypothetical protein FSP39_023569 [Pinctada imbricata]